jgi:hypothetical protein
MIPRIDPPHMPKYSDLDEFMTVRRHNVSRSIRRVPLETRQASWKRAAAYQACRWPPGL